MKRNLFWKSLLILFVVGWSLWELYPLTPRNLIDEFDNRADKRDATFTNILQQARQADQASPGRAYQNLVAAIGSHNLTNFFTSIKVAGESDPNRAILHQLQLDSAGKIKLGLDLQGGTSFLVSLETNSLEKASAQQTALAQAVEVMRKRVDKFGVAEPLIQPVGDNRILIQLPGLSEAEKTVAKSTIQKAAFLEFRLVHPESSDLLRQDMSAPGHERLQLVRKDRRTGEQSVQYYLVKKKAEKGLTGSFVKRAFPDLDAATGQAKIILEFNDAGAALFADVTTESVGRQLAIVLDGALYSAPVIQEPIRGGTASITGDFDVAEAYALANVLENPLQAPVRLESEYSVEPSLGKDSIRSGIKSALIGTFAVACFMLVYYLFAGLVANVALMLNIIILLGVMCSIGTVLTLPGIAGIVLTIGMAVDANVLIFERIREESQSGKSMRGALTSGYDKAFGTIFDSNLTTLIASTILIFMGTGPIKGFGVTLTIGVTASMFTSLVVTRLVFDFLLARGWLKSLPMLHLIRGSRIDFLSVTKVAFALSWALVVIGVGYGFYRGKGALGVDFAGGDRMTLEFSKKVEDVSQIRSVITKLNVGEPLIQPQKDLVTGSERLQVTAGFNSTEKVVAALKEAFPQAEFHLIESFNVGPSMGQQILKTAIISTLLALFGILIYVAMRYEFSFAIGAVVAVIHDVLMTLGWFCLTGREFSSPMVAAILTIIGFSINDTIVIFDRIREDLKLGVRGSFRDVMNVALNQTLSRTIITSGTVFLATSSLFLFGGPVINDFAFTFLIGILTGTYSSIYIACAFVLWWHKGERPKASSQVAMDNTVAARV